MSEFNFNEDKSILNDLLGTTSKDYSYPLVNLDITYRKPRRRYVYTNRIVILHNVNC